MDKKLNDTIIRTNLIFLILSISTTILFIVKIGFILFTECKGVGVLIYDVKSTIFMIKIYVTNYHYNSIYTIANYPLIPLAGGIIYNLYVMIKNQSTKKVDS